MTTKKNKVGRPLIDPGFALTEKLTVRLSPEEWAALEATKEAAGYEGGTATYVRHLIRQAINPAFDFPSQATSQAVKDFKPTTYHVSTG